MWREKFFIVSFLYLLVFLLLIGCGERRKVVEMEVGSVPALRVGDLPREVTFERVFEYLKEVEKMCEVENYFIVYFPQLSFEGVSLYFPLKDTSYLDSERFEKGDFRFTRLELFNIAKIGDENIYEFKPDSEKFNLLVSHVGRHRYNMLIPGFYQVYYFSKGEKGYSISKREVWVSYRVHRRSKPVGD
jgi:hypothetical protein